LLFFCCFFLCVCFVYGKDENSHLPSNGYDNRCAILQCFRGRTAVFNIIGCVLLALFFAAEGGMAGYWVASRGKPVAYWISGCWSEDGFASALAASVAACTGNGSSWDAPPAGCVGAVLAFLGQHFTVDGAVAIGVVMCAQIALALALAFGMAPRRRGSGSGGQPVLGSNPFAPGNLSVNNATTPLLADTAPVPVTQRSAMSQRSAAYGSAAFPGPPGTAPSSLTSRMVRVARVAAGSLL
jgi:hypothetical protein